MSGLLRKQPDEEFKFTVDFATNLLASSEGIASEAVTVLRQSDGVDVTADIINGLITENAGIVTIPIKAGVTEERYTVKTVVTTDAVSPNIYELDVVIEVRELP